MLDKIVSRWGVDAAAAQFEQQFEKHKGSTPTKMEERCAIWQGIAEADSIPLLGKVVQMLDGEEIVDLVSYYTAHCRPQHRSGMNQWLTEMSINVLMDNLLATETYLEMALALGQCHLMCLPLEVEFPSWLTSRIADLFEMNATWYECYTLSLYHPEFRPWLLEKLQYQGEPEKTNSVVKERVFLMTKLFSEVYQDEAVWDFCESLGIDVGV